MKFLSGISLAAILLAGAATPSFATSLAPGDTVSPGANATPNYLGVVNFTILGNTGAVNYSNGPNSGTMQEWVGYLNAAPGNLIFVYQVTVASGDVHRVTGGDYSGFATDVFTNVGSGTSNPFQGTRSANTGVVVGFNFSPDMLPSDESFLMIVVTNANGFTTGPFSVIDDTTTTMQGFAPANTPEPSTLSLLGTGLLAVGAGIRRKMLRK